MVGYDLAQYQQCLENFGHADKYGAVLHLRIQLLKGIDAKLETVNWTHENAAQKLGVKRPRGTEIDGLKPETFSVELLDKHLSQLGKEVSFDSRSARR